MNCIDLNEMSFFLVLVCSGLSFFAGMIFFSAVSVRRERKEYFRGKRDGAREVELRAQPQDYANRQRKGLLLHYGRPAK